MMIAQECLYRPRSTFAQPTEAPIWTDVRPLSVTISGPIRANGSAA